MLLMPIADLLLALYTSHSTSPYLPICYPCREKLLSQRQDTACNIHATHAELTALLTPVIVSPLDLLILTDSFAISLCTLHAPAIIHERLSTQIGETSCETKR